MFNKPVCGRWDVILSLVFSLDNPLVKAWGSSLSFAAYKVGKNFLGEQTYKPSSVPRPSRGGDHPSSPDVTIGVKRPTRGSRPSTLSLSRSQETSGQLGPLIRSCSGWGLSSQPVSRSLVSSYLAISPLPAPRCYRGRWRFVSVALSVGFPLLGVTQHPARWSSDFPPQLHRGGHPVYSPKSIL